MSLEPLNYLLVTVFAHGNMSHELNRFIIIRQDISRIQQYPRRRRECGSLVSLHKRMKNSDFFNSQGCILENIGNVFGIIADTL